MKEITEKFDRVVSSYYVDDNNAPNSMKFTRYGRTFEKPFERIDNALNIDGQLPYTGKISIDDLRVAFGRKWKHTASNILALGGVFDGYANDTYREISISCTDDKIQQRLGMQKMQLSTVIKQACKINLIKCTNNHFNLQTNGRYYIFNKLIYQQLQNLLGIDNTTITNTNTNNTTMADDNTAAESNTDNPYKISYSCRIDATDAEIIAGLHKQYPLLREYQDKVARLNKRIDNNLLQMSLAPSITRGQSGIVSKVGIRCTSPFCQTRKDDRYTILHDELGYNNIYEFDVKSSIYRVAYWLHAGIWADNDIDFYSVMLPDGSPMARSVYKKFAMRLYFASTPKQCFARLQRATRKAGIDMADDMRDDCDAYYHAMRAVIGESVGSEIFLYESMLYVDLLDALMQLGYNVAQVYDCFYSDNENIGVACKKLLPALARVLYDKLGKTPQKGGDLAALMMARGNTTDKHTDAHTDAVAAMDAVDDVMSKATAKANEQEQEKENLMEKENKALTEGEFVDAVMQKPKSTPESRAAWEQREAERQAEKSLYDAYIKEMATATENATDKTTEKPASPTPDNVANIVDYALTSAKTDASSDDDGDKWAWLDAYGIA